MHPVLFQIGPLLVPSYGVVASLGVLLALWLAQWTAPRAAATGAPMLTPRHAWNMIVLAVFAGLTVSRLVLIAVNLADLRRHPGWLLAVAMVHHPLLAAAGVTGGGIAVLAYAHWAHLPLRAVGDCLAPPVALAMACDQMGALLAGSDFGAEASGPWSLTYSSPLAARWSGTPLGVPLEPVQVYAAAGAILVAALTAWWFRVPRQTGDVCSVWLLATGAVAFVTEFWRDREGRGAMWGGLVDIPQLVGLGLVVLGGLVMWRGPRQTSRKG